MKEEYQMEIKKVFIVGAGRMGIGIAEVCAEAGYDVVMTDMNDEILAKGMQAIKRSVERAVEKGKVKGTVEAILSRIKTSIKLESAKDADVVVEAVFEDIELKRGIFRQLAQICPAHTILGTNTSGIPTTDIAAATQRPDKVVGIHFFNPVPVQRIVEVVKGLSTSEETVEAAMKFCRSLDKEIIRINRDVQGFALVRIDIVSYVEAMKLVEEGVASVEDIDKGFRLGYGRPMGPFETRDFAGLDIGWAVLQNLYQETGDTKFLPPMILRRKIAAGHLGKSVGIGWYRYDEKGNRIGPA
jgi:3-hydroxybutyryl-CoA dehydrogenase